MTDETENTGVPEAEGVLGRSKIEKTEEGETVVVKLLEHVEIPDRNVFERQFEALMRLDHTHLVSYLGQAPEATPVRIAEEYVDGTQFLTYMRRAPTVEEIRTLHRRFDDDEEDRQPEREDVGTAPDDESEPGSPSEDAEKTEDETSDTTRFLSEQPVPEEHSYAEARLGGEQRSDVIHDPPDEYEGRQIELIDVVFLRLERLMPQILGALEYLHRFDVPHGALRPTNLFVDTAGHCKLADYGLVSEVELVRELPEGPGDSGPPPEEALAYAHAYLAPEFEGDLDATPAGDLYALGCMLFETITGCRPSGLAETRERDLEDESRPISEELDAVEDVPNDEDELEAVHADSGDDSRPPLPASALAELEPRCPAAWTDVILRLLDSNPERRPDFEEIREALASSPGRSVDVPPSFIPEQEAFFGRNETFDQLVDRAQTCVAEKSMRMTVLSGAAGYGKTAMARRLGRWAAQRGWIVLRGRCYDQESLIYQGWNEIAGQLGEISRRAIAEGDADDERTIRRAARLFPDINPDALSDEPLARLDAIDALRELLGVVAAERPVLLVLDDLNWANPDTIELLADLLGDPEKIECMILATWRLDDENAGEPSIPEELSSAPASIDLIDLRQLRRSEAEAYLDTIADLGPDQRESVLEAGGSNPLLLQEIIYQIHLEHSENVDAPDDAGDEPRIMGDERETLADPDVSVREKLVELIRERLAGISRRAEFVLQLLSVVSLPLPESVISFVVDQEFHSGEEFGTSVRPLLDELRTQRLVEVVQTERWNQTYILFHNLTRRMILDEIPVQRYTHLCDHLADGLRRLWPDAVELRFEYLLRSDRTEEAIDTAVRTARRAESRFAYRRAAKMWRWLDEQKDQAARMTSIEPQEELAQVEFLARRYDRAASLYRELANDMPSGIAKSRLEYREFEAWLACGHRDDAISALDGALGTFDDRYERANLIQKFSEWKHRTVAATQRWSDDLDEMTHEPLGGTETLRLQLYRQVILKNDILNSTRGRRFRAKFSAIAEQSGNARLLGHDRLFLARDCHLFGINESLSQAEKWYDETSELFDISEDHFGAAQMALGRAALLRDSGAFEEAETSIDEAARRMARVRPIEAREMQNISYERALLRRERGDLTGAAEIAHKLRHFRRGHGLSAFRARQILLPIRLLQGEVSRAEVLVDACREFLDSGPVCFGSVWLNRQRTRLNLARGRPDVALGHHSVLLDDLRKDGLMRYPYVAVTFRLGRAQARIAQLTRKDRLGEPRQNELFEQTRNDVDAIRDYSEDLSPSLGAEVDRLSARFELLRDNVETAYDYLEGATERLAQYRNPLARSMCAEALGMALRRDEPDHGTSLIEQSRVVYDHHGCHYPLVLEGWPVPDRISKLRPSPG